MPTASRACGERICRVEARRGFLAVFAAGFFLREAGRPLPLDERLAAGRDDLRRDGEVFVAIDR
jgi:hypothetical protein